MTKFVFRLCLVSIFLLYPYMVTDFVIAQHLFLDNDYSFHDIPSREQSEGKLEGALGHMEDDSCGQVYGLRYLILLRSWSDNADAA